MRTRRIAIALALIPCLLSVLVAFRYLQPSVDPHSGLPQFPDAITYLAAGERLNSGHDLYMLGPGDRPVSINSRISPAALLSPPTIAVLWRPIAFLPFGFALWVAAAWAALLGTAFYLVYRSGLRGAVLAAALSPAIGEQLAVCNVAAFFPLLLTLAWRWRGTAASGAIVGLMASIKLAPGAMGGWLVGVRAWRAVAATAMVLLAAILICIIGAGPSSIPKYIEVARSIGPSEYSLSGLTGIGWLTPAVLIGGTLCAIALGRWPAWSFIVAVTASVLGTPALYVSGLVTLLATLAPAADQAGVTEHVGTIGELPVDNAIPN